MSLQYLEALKALGASPSTKFVIPFEFTRLLEPFLDFVQPTAANEGGSARVRRRRDHAGEPLARPRCHRPIRAPPISGG